MSKSQLTREKIIRDAADLFNIKGYSGTSISDLMEKTGLKKGGIYNHFESKEHLAQEVFEYSFSLLKSHYTDAMQGVDSPMVRLRKFIEAFRNFFFAPPLPGGCPLFNIATETDDSLPFLRERVKSAANEWKKIVSDIVWEGVTKGEIKNQTNPDEVAAIITSLIGGALVLARVQNDTSYLYFSINHLNVYLEKLTN